jgi:L-proline amide hydrolase
LQDLATRFDTPVIFYDQIGCGNSTHLKEKAGDEAFWTVELFIDELNNLIEHFRLESYDVFGNSWGGMLAAEFGITKPKGLNRLIIADAPASMRDWVKASRILKAQLPTDIRETLDRCENNGDYDSPEFEKACMYFYHLHVCRMDPWPQEIIDAFANLDDDKTVYLTMNGPSEFTITGSLKDWSVKGRLGAVKNDVLLLNGRYDEAMDMVVEPYWKELGGKTRWYTFATGSHMPFWEERDHFMDLVAQFLKA